ncbi:MAG: cyclic nucleotide-binding domain-containing protein [Candidatus Cloacimonadota bacterium]|nr:cyclic nucleotide-binding domain-containing protein [Candidatus Cloacimonadota bacterium]
MAEKNKQIRDNPIFHNLSKKEAEYIIKNSSLQTLAAEQYFLKEKPLNDTLAIILKGHIIITNDEKKILADLNETDFFGEISLFISNTENLCIQAKTITELFIFSKKTLQNTLKAKPGLATKILKNISKILAERLRITNNQLQELQK